jgi:hypothetical protein
MTPMPGYSWPTTPCPMRTWPVLHGFDDCNLAVSQMMRRTQRPPTECLSPRKRLSRLSSVHCLLPQSPAGSSGYPAEPQLFSSPTQSQERVTSPCAELMHITAPRPTLYTPPHSARAPRCCPPSRWCSWASTAPSTTISPRAIMSLP